MNQSNPINIFTTTANLTPTERRNLELTLKALEEKYEFDKQIAINTAVAESRWNRVGHRLVAHCVEEAHTTKGQNNLR